jgi:rare lipoprotein A
MRNYNKALVVLIFGLTFSRVAAQPNAAKQVAGFVADSISLKSKTPDSLNLNLIYKPYKKKVHASYYADKFNGRKTASGQKFSNSKYTAAHKRLPFGTKVRVTNEANGKSVIVTINDRGPFVKMREIDLSKKAFMDITHKKGAGGLTVTIEEVVTSKSHTTK